MAVRDLVCFHCKKPIAVGNFIHDKDRNLLCKWCNGVLFALTETLEDALKKTTAESAHVAYHYLNNKREPLPIKLQD